MAGGKPLKQSDDLILGRHSNQYTEFHHFISAVISRNYPTFAVHVYHSIHHAEDSPDWNAVAHQRDAGTARCAAHGSDGSFDTTLRTPVGCRLLHPIPTRRDMPLRRVTPDSSRR